MTLILPMKRMKLVELTLIYLMFGDTLLFEAQWNIRA